MTSISRNTALNSAVGLNILAESVEKILSGFIADCIRKTSSDKAVIGLSGGLDSSVVASLAAKRLGPDNVLGVIMPYRSSSPESKNDAELIASHLKVSTEIVDVTPMADAYCEQRRDLGDNRRGNYLARQRMAVLYDISARENGLVIGTSNKSELLLGYGTIFGDLGHAINPVGDLYKTQIRQLAHYLDIPETIQIKVPSADLISSQTDEGDLGFTYEEVDKLLYLWVDRQMTEQELVDQGFKIDFIKNVISRVRKNHFKRIPPLIAKVSAATIGHEFRYAWEWSTIS